MSLKKQKANDDLTGKTKKKSAAKPAAAENSEKKPVKKAVKKAQPEKAGESAAAPAKAKKPGVVKAKKNKAAEPVEAVKEEVKPPQPPKRLIISISRPEGYVPPPQPAKPEVTPPPPAPPVVTPAPVPAPAVSAAPVIPPQPAKPDIPPSGSVYRPAASAQPHRPAAHAFRPSSAPAHPSQPAKHAAPQTPAQPVKPAAPVPAAGAKSVPAPAPVEPKELQKLKVSTQVVVRELAEKMNVKPTDYIKKLMSMGVFATINQRLDPDVATLVAVDYGYDLEIVPIFDEEAAEVVETEKPENLKPRYPIVTIMGHVDHGKTTLLDALRESNVVDSEAGQITQHIGAYMVSTPRGKITILDTPGHEAFTAMRAHGVKITDIVILVVSAVDGVMPQTLEAVNHAKAANVPIIVAINKMDLPTANPQDIKQRLANIGLNPEDWGGSTVMVEISAKKRTNLDKLLELVSIQAEMMELKANPDKMGSGIVIESRLDSQKGIVATVITESGTIKVGDPFVVGTSHGKVRALVNDRGARLERIGPSEPAELLGIGGQLPHAGDIFKIYATEKEARHVAEKRKLHKREESLIHQKHVSLLSLKSQVDQKLLKNLNVVLKTDVFGSLQAIKDSLEKLSNQEVAIRILHSGVGNITESDVLLAKASDAVIFGFHVDADSKVKEEAKASGVEIRTYKIIYDLIEDIKAAMSGLLEPEVVETVTGRAEIQQIFDLSSGKVAGSLVKEGKVVRGQPVRLLRGKDTVYTGKISGLKRFKEDVKEVEKGLECGILLEGYRNFQTGDILEAVTREERVRRIRPA
ncbi:MAG: translation initiation factor IF-2 [Elusimicrobia bacterium GWA2_56_46]|nr:MAG: translation initiation factor IF-2 [Elusimicrobia bacterium GWA2_56_46]OGR55640.1 MAG: translation initiation factor IF-2 [Elusimicrobia bacterium GWC2_56_31]HBW22755.1 translation initiation factor IF-2 [Elusimicrobiota bacterium]